jgi:aspartyl-tRNA(Asn)/glutamyl-tRNA(Gln) amidotransferase subunit C
MSLAREDVRKVAFLARLRLEDHELDLFTSQLNSIVDFVAQLQEPDTSRVEPLAHGVELTNVFRDDARVDALTRAAALANAPKANGESFLVPVVLD